MVSNSDVKQEFDMFSDMWKLFKGCLPVGSSEDDAYWNKTVEAVKAFMNKYPSPFGRGIAIAVLDELERRGKVYGKEL